MGITADKWGCICEKCNKVIAESRTEFPTFCLACGENIIRGKIRRLLEKYNPPNERDILEFIFNKERAVRCPLCGSHARVLGVMNPHIHCKFCDKFYYRNARGYFVVLDLIEQQYIEYLSDCMSSYVIDASTLMESADNSDDDDWTEEEQKEILEETHIDECVRRVDTLLKL